MVTKMIFKAIMIKKNKKNPSLLRYFHQWRSGRLAWLMII